MTLHHLLNPSTKRIHSQHSQLQPTISSPPYNAEKHDGRNISKVLEWNRMPPSTYLILAVSHKYILYRSHLIFDVTGSLRLFNPALYFFFVAMDTHALRVLNPGS